MRTKIAFYLIFFLALAVCSCSKLDEKGFYEKALKKELFSLDSISTVVVVPGTGCPGCITGIENFVKGHYNKVRDTKIVMTYVASKKRLTLKLGKECIASDNVFVDNDNFFYHPTSENNIYPTILFLNGKEVVNLIHLSPKNQFDLSTLLYP